MKEQLENINDLPILINRKRGPSIVNLFGEKSTQSKVDINKIYRYYKSLINILQLNFSDNESIKLANKLIALKILEYKSNFIINYQVIKDDNFILLIESFLNKIHYSYLSEYFLDLSILPINIIKMSFRQIEKMELFQFVDDNYTVNDILGAIFEKHINKKELGAYYTSKETTDYIVERTIISYLINDNYSPEKTINNKFLFKYIKQQSKKQTLNKLRKIKILDPTCGSGAFIFSAYSTLLKIYKILAEDLNRKELFHFIFKNNLYGIDIDDKAIELLRFRIVIESIQHKDSNFINLFKNFLIGNTLVGSIDIKNTKNPSEENKSFYTLENNGKIFPTETEKNWISKVKPLHLNIIYKDILNSGGFDCIIGNPPYVEYNKTFYKLSDYFSIKSGNLYAYVLERSIKLLKNNGFIGMIIPISFISTPRMKYIREFFNNNLDFQFISSFADRPSSLFLGVHQKLNIVIGRKNTNQAKTRVFTSSYLHWNKSNSHLLYNDIQYIENNISTDNQFYYKIGNKIEKEIILKILNRTPVNIIDNTNKQGNYSIWLNMRLLFWNKSFFEEQKSKEYKKFSFHKESFAKIFYSLTNSNLFFFFWEMVSDGWHITNKDLSTFRIDFNDFTDDIINELDIINKELILNLETNKKEVNTKQTNFEYQHKKAKVIIDKFDNIFADYFFLTEEEVNYLRYYNIRYRMNSELKNYLNINKYEYV